MTLRGGARAAARSGAQSGELDFGAAAGAHDRHGTGAVHDSYVDSAALRDAAGAAPGDATAAAPGDAAAAAPSDATAPAPSDATAAAQDVAARVGRIDWPRVERDLDAQGCAIMPSLLTPAECAQVIAGYDDDAHFRSRVVMARHGFGRGEYKYFRYPLPPLVAQLRGTLYPHLVPVANRWHEQLREPARFPPSHAAFLRRCHAAGQRRPTPLVLRYAAGDYNCLHQDLYGEHVFPLQVAVLLAEPGRDFEGGEFVLTEQRPRMQSRVQVVSLRRGDAVVFAVHHRPVQGTRGFYRVNLRHGVSEIRRGARHTLGLIFHDAT